MCITSPVNNLEDAVFQMAVGVMLYWQDSFRPYALTPNTVELIPTLGALFPRGGPVQDLVLTNTHTGATGGGAEDGFGVGGALHRMFGQVQHEHRRHLPEAHRPHRGPPSLHIVWALQFL